MVVVMAGEPRWKEPKDDTGWPAARLERLAVDGYRCQASRFGLTSECGELWLGLDVHHRLPRGRGGDNRLENLVTLCPFHHRWVETHRRKAYRLGLLLRSES